MSSRPPSDHKQQLQQGLAEIDVHPIVKSKYYKLLEAIHKDAEQTGTKFTVAMIEILEKHCHDNNIFWDTKDSSDPE